MCPNMCVASPLPSMHLVGGETVKTFQNVLNRCFFHCTMHFVGGVAVFRPLTPSEIFIFNLVFLN